MSESDKIEGFINKEISAPFTDEQVNAMNAFQEAGRFHPFTCCSPEEIEGCYRKNNIGDSYEEKEGILKATNDGWVCPCGKYKQNWAHSFMATPDPRDKKENGSDKV